MNRKTKQMPTHAKGSLESSSFLISMPWQVRLSSRLSSYLTLPFISRSIMINLPTSWSGCMTQQSSATTTNAFPRSLNRKIRALEGHNPRNSNFNAIKMMKLTTMSRASVHLRTTKMSKRKSKGWLLVLLRRIPNIERKKIRYQLMPEWSNA